MHNFNISISYKSNFFWFTNYKSDIFHFASFSPLLFSRCVSPFLLPVVSPRSGFGSKSWRPCACYGLANAPIRWFESVAATMEDLGLEQLQTEPCCWRCTETDGSGEKRLVGLVVAHVDDFLFGGDQLQ